ncbi:MAG: FAD-dependent oxidoreductase [Deltaproteobacteria bacterium]
MARRNTIVIIGGTACGPKAAARARRCDPHASITLVEQGTTLSTATCGMPYYISGVINNQENLVGQHQDFFHDVIDTDVLSRTQATAVDRNAHTVDIHSLDSDRGSKLEYDKLVIATGSVPVVPDLEGSALGGIFTLTKIEDALAIRKAISPHTIKHAVIIGAGLIGLEMVESFITAGLKVTVIEALDWVLPALMDFEIAASLDRHLRAQGANLLLGQRVMGFEGNGKGWVRKVITGDTELEAEIVLLAIGAKPNTRLAREAGLSIGSTGGIAVNHYLQTSDPDIYAGGDCVENVNLITQQKVLVQLGSTANKHGRVIGTNVTGGSETFPGVLGTTIAKVFDYNVGRVGMSERQARKAGLDVVTSLVPGSEHASYYPDDKEILVKLVAEKDANRLLGGQAVGAGDTAKRIDVLATALTFGATVDDLANVDLAYAPPYNSAMDPLHHAANVIRNKLSGYARALSPMEVKQKLDAGDDFIFLDVRSPEEFNISRLEAQQTQLLPLGDLRKKIDSFPSDAEIVIFCQTSVRAYQAQRILDGAGFTDVSFMEGSISAWPYEVIGRR